MADIVCENVTKVYPDGTTAVKGVDLQVPDGALMVLVGPSGCGKTTLLRMVAGLEDITEGAIAIGGKVVNGTRPKGRDIAMVFQNYALYPHMSVYDNMAFSLKLRHVNRREIRRRVTTTAETLGLSELLKKKPRHLSGGQRQRVAMGRAIVREPRAFLMDEPLSNLDAKLRVEMRSEIARIQRTLGVTTIYVTHDQTEAMTLGHMVAVMRHGVVQQVAEPQALFDDPANLFVAGFVGSPAMNLVEAQISSENGHAVVSFGQIRLALPEGEVRRRVRLIQLARERGQVIVGIRPEDIYDAELLPDPASDVCFTSHVELREVLGREVYVHFTVDAPPVVTPTTRELAADVDPMTIDDLEDQVLTREARFVARVSSRTRARAGERMRFAVDTTALSYFEPATGDAIL